MKKLRVLFILVSFVIFSTELGAAASTDDIEKTITQAEQALLGNTGAPPDIVQTLTQLIDCAAALSKKSQYVEEIKAQLDIAKNEFSQESFFSDKGRQKLKFAYRMLTDGQKYQVPAELDDFVTPAQATENARKYITKLFRVIKKDYRAGYHLRSAKNLVVVVLLIVTPMEG